jgi:hypothetical protein
MMMYLRTARVAMVALTALGMIWASTAQAAGHEISVYSHYPQHLDNPTTPLPGQTGQTIDTRGDVKVSKPTRVQYYAKNLTTTWTIRVDSIGNYPVKDVSVDILHTRMNKVNMDEREEEWIHVDFGDMAPGAVKTTTVTCQEKADRLPCHGVAVWLNALDRDDSNNWTSGALFDAIKKP